MSCLKGIKYRIARYQYRIVELSMSCKAIYYLLSSIWLPGLNKKGGGESFNLLSFQYSWKSLNLTSTITYIFYRAVRRTVTFCSLKYQRGCRPEYVGCCRGDCKHHCNQNGRHNLIFHTQGDELRVILLFRSRYSKKYLLKCNNEYYFKSPRILTTPCASTI